MLIHMSWKELHNLMTKADANGHILKKTLDLNLQKVFEMKGCWSWHEFSGDIGKRLQTMGSLLAAAFEPHF